MEQRHIMITGGAGFIGSHLCDLFLADGYYVTAVDNFVTGSLANLEEAQKNDRFSLVEWDLAKLEEAPEVPFLEEHGLHGILHFACPASPVDFAKIPFQILKVDSLGTIRMVNLASRHSSRFVVASTSEVYGDPLEHPQKETYWGNVNPTGPRACYDEAKRFSEAYVSCAVRGAETIAPLNGGIVRIFNTYGPRMRPDDGRVVPEFCMQALKGLPIEVHGDGSQTRSYCFVSDLVRGIRKYYDSDCHDPINLGNPQELSVKLFGEKVVELTQSSSALSFTEAREDDPKRRRPDITRANELLDWNPEVSLDAGLAETIEYFRSHLK